MTNNSSTGGYLVPNPAPAPQPLEGKALLNFVQEVVVGITGMDPTLVRPRFQSEPPVIPDAGTAWCSLAINVRRSDTFAYVTHDPGATLADGADKLQRQEYLDVLATFYDLGVDGLADYYASLLRDGFSIAQNLEVLQANGWGLGYTQDLTPAPVLNKQRWQYRVDMPFQLRRQIDRTYPVLNLESAQGTLKTDIQPNDQGEGYNLPFAVNPPA